MGKKKRTRLELIHDILKIVKSHDNSIKFTPLLRYLNISSQRFSLYLAELLEKEFVKEVKEAKARSSSP